MERENRIFCKITQVENNRVRRGHTEIGQQVERPDTKTVTTDFYKDRTFSVKCIAGVMRKGGQVLAHRYILIGKLIEIFVKGNQLFQKVGYSLGQLRTEGGFRKIFMALTADASAPGIEGF